MSRLHHDILIIGGGTAGISVAARLRKAGVDDVAVIEPADTHYYQPLWTLVGGGCAPAKESARPMASVMPAGVKWIQDAATDIDPENKVVTTEAGVEVEYGQLVVAPGIQLDWDGISGLSSTLGTGGVSSNYRYDLAPKTWEFIKGLRSGKAVFTMPSGPIKCAGAPQKIAYLAADWWRKQGVLDAIDITLVLPTPGMFGLPEFAKPLKEVADDYGIEVRFSSEVIEVDAEAREVTVVDLEGDTKERIGYDVLHVVPPQSAPDWIKASPLSAPDNPKGYVDVHKHTHQHVRHPDVFSLGDAGSTPNSKTGAAIRKQAPVVVENLLAHRAGTPLPGSYDGYASCPLTTSRNRMLLAEFDYSMTHQPTFPVIDLTKPRYDMWLVKRYGLPAMYWNAMLKGRA